MRIDDQEWAGWDALMALPPRLTAEERARILAEVRARRLDAAAAKVEPWWARRAPEGTWR